MKNLRRTIARFFYQNRDKGIRNLMLYIFVGNIIVYAFSLIDPSNVLYQALYFNREAILHGQVWRLFSYVFTEMAGATGFNVFFSVLFLFCYFIIGRQLEAYWGTLRFNCYYFSGIILMDIAGLLLQTTATSSYLNLSLFLAYATIAPDTRFLLFYIIPVKAKYLAWVYMGITLLDIVGSFVTTVQAGMTYVLPLRAYLLCFYPLIALLNYILFFGKDIQNVLPDFMRYRTTKTQRAYRANQRPNPNWSADYRSSTGEKPYHHKCTVCGRTDVTNPELEFRYCSKCKGYYCYCMDHINNHVHIQ